MLHNQKLKILLIPTWYPNEKNPIDGIFIQEHAKAISLFNEVTVLYSRKVKKNLKGIYRQTTDESEEGIRTIRIEYEGFLIPKTAYFVNIFAIWKFFNKLCKEGWKPDIIHAHVFGSGVPAILIGKLYKIPVVITEHLSKFSLHNLKFLDIILARFVMNNAKMILPVSHSLKKGIESYKIKNKFKVIPNVVNTSIFYPSFQPQNNSTKKILLVASLIPIKGIRFLLDELGQLKKKRKDFVLDIIGDGENAQEYKQLTKELNLDNFINFHGRQSKQQVADFMKKCSFLILTSLWETQSCVLIEAMACGKPIVASNIGGIPEIVTNKIGLLVSPKDTYALEHAINRMLDNFQNYSSKYISDNTRNNFSYEVVGKKITEIYNKVLVTYC